MGDEISDNIKSDAVDDREKDYSFQTETCWSRISHLCILYRISLSNFCSQQSVATKALFLKVLDPKTFGRHGSVVGIACVTLITHLMGANQILIASLALGTVKAMEMGAIGGAISGLATGIMGVMTALLIPVARLLMLF